MARRTLKNKISFSGVGLHSGKSVMVTLMPAESYAGYGFLFDGVRYPIQSAGHSGDGRGTILTFDRYRIMTVEHLLAALRGLGIDDVTISPQGEEIPLLDGSAEPFCREILACGIYAQNGDPNPMRISSPVYAFSDDEKKFCAAYPSDRLRFTYVIEYPRLSAIGTQTATVEPNPENFTQELAQCRTFCLYEEVEQMRAAGLGLGGSVESALIVKGLEILTPGGLRCPDEFVRHKILDMIGDLALLGRPIVGHFIAIRAGHAMHQKLVDALYRKLLKEMSVCSI